MLTGTGCRTAGWRTAQTREADISQSYSALVSVVNLTLLSSHFGSSFCLRLSLTELLP